MGGWVDSVDHIASVVSITEWQSLGRVHGKTKTRVEQREPKKKAKNQDQAVNPCLRLSSLLVFRVTVNRPSGEKCSPASGLTTSRL